MEAIHLKSVNNVPSEDDTSQDGSFSANHDSPTKQASGDEMCE